MRRSQVWQNLKSALRDVGLLLHVPGVMALISIAVALIANEGYAVLPFLKTAIAAIGLGQLLFWRCRRSNPSYLPQSMLTVAIAWGLIPLLGAIPFYEIAHQLPISSGADAGAFRDPWNAVFEAFSGFTSTGLSMAQRSSDLPYTVQWWRTFTQWIGGVGVIVLMLSVLQFSTDAYHLYSAEGRSKRIGLTVRQTARRIWWIYLTYSLGAIALLWLSGMPLWHAFNHGLTGIATGGFTVTDGSIGAYDAPVQWATLLVFVVGAVSFSTHAQVWRGKFSALWGNAGHRWLWRGLVLGALFLILVRNVTVADETVWRESVFQWASALTTCGFSSTGVRYWAVSGKMLLVVAMLCGAVSGSTAGGLKLDRVAVLGRSFIWRMKQFGLSPHQKMRYDMGDRVFDEKQAWRLFQSAALLALLWFTTLFIATLGLAELTRPETSLMNIIFDATSALGGVGLSTGIASSSLPWGGKAIFIVLMWGGRLEIIPTLLLFSVLAKGLWQLPQGLRD